MRPRNPAKEDFWRGLLRLWRQSGLSGRQFCAQQGVSEASFYAWRRVIARRDRQQASARKWAAVDRPTSGPAFVPLALPSSTETAPAIEVVVRRQRVVRVAPGFDAETLRQLLRLLEEPSC